MLCEDLYGKAYNQYAYTTNEQTKQCHYNVPQALLRFEKDRKHVMNLYALISWLQMQIVLKE